MKKILKLFFKKKRKTNLYNIYDEPLTESNSSSTDNAMVTDSYKSFQFDCYCNDNENDTTLRKNQLQELEAPICSISNSSTLQANLTQLNSKADSLSSKRNLEIVQERKPNKSSLISINSDFSDTSVTDDVFIKARNEPTNYFECTKNWKNTQKAKSGSYVINISNSKCFHIGPQKTINVNGCLKTIKGCDILRDSNAVNGVDVISNLLASKQRLSEDSITLISLYIDHRWKEFGKSLGFKETFLEDLEDRYDHNRAIAVYDSLQEYIKQYPNTSLGFVTNLLKLNEQMTVIEKLGQKNIGMILR